MSPQEDTQKASRQCWECLKRRLVCDYTMPDCRKCIKKGRECPGYDAQKPLQWVENGKITSRKRAKPSKNSQLLILPSRPPVREPSRNASPRIRYYESEKLDLFEREELRNIYQKAIADVNNLEDVYKIADYASQDVLADIIKRGSKEEAAEILKVEKDPLKGLRRMLRYMRLENLPRYNLHNDTCEAVQAMQYFNMRVIPESVGAEHALVPNNQIIYFPISALHLLNPATHSSFICIALQHHIMRLPPGERQQALVAQGPKMLKYRGEAIHELAERIANPQTMYSFTTITSVGVFLTNELQSQMQPNWRSHIDVLMRIAKLRGGMMSIYRNNYFMHPSIVLFHLIIIFSNTTSPAHDQIVLAETVKEDLENAEELYHEVFPYNLCPPSVFFFIIRISHLRREASQRLILEEDMTDLCALATELLSQIESFSANDWAQPGPDYDDWLTIGSAYKHAVAIYCIMACQSLALFPISEELGEARARHSDLLGTHLRTALSVSRLRRFVTWCLVVSGAEAAYQSEGRRKWIEDVCSDLARSLGTACSLNLKSVLGRYWESENPGWEECFNQPYAFMF